MRPGHIRATRVLTVDEGRRREGFRRPSRAPGVPLKLRSRSSMRSGRKTKRKTLVCRRSSEFCFVQCRLLLYQNQRFNAAALAKVQHERRRRYKGIVEWMSTSHPQFVRLAQPALHSSFRRTEMALTPCFSGVKYFTVFHGNDF